MLSKEVIRSVKCTLTAAEIEAGGRDLARKIGTLAQLEDNKKAATSQYKSEIDRVSAEIRSLGLKVANGYEFRELTCDTVYDFDLKRASVICRSTGEVVETRIMTAQEVQLSLEFEAQADAAVEPGQDVGHERG
jgi:hypothetical protein